MQCRPATPLTGPTGLGHTQPVACSSFLCIRVFWEKHGNECGQPEGLKSSLQLIIITIKDALSLSGNTNMISHSVVLGPDTEFRWTH